jgi:hypothetical protein
VLGRFRYSDLKEAACLCGGRGLKGSCTEGFIIDVRQCTAGIHPGDGILLSSGYLVAMHAAASAAPAASFKSASGKSKFTEARTWKYSNWIRSPNQGYSQAGRVPGSTVLTIVLAHEAVRLAAAPHY